MSYSKTLTQDERPLLSPHDLLVFINKSYILRIHVLRIYVLIYVHKLYALRMSMF